MDEFIVFSFFSPHPRLRAIADLDVVEAWKYITAQILEHEAKR